MTRTPLTYYGGKQRLARAIVAHMPPHRVYLEPFAGGAAVLFAKPRVERETLNDVDRDIVRFWRVLRERPVELAEAVATTPYARAEWEASDDVAPDDEIEGARRLLVNVDQSFSRSRQSWSPPHNGTGRWQPQTWANLPPLLLAAAERLQGVGLERANALELIPRWDLPDAVIYCDPPYTGEHRTHGPGGARGGGHGYRHDDDGKLWPHLVDVLLDIRHAAVILSGYPCAEADDLGWTTVTLPAKRTVGARGAQTLDIVPETLWLSPRVPAPVARLFA